MLISECTQLQKNSFGPKGGTAIANSLERLTLLETLDLGSNYMEDNALEALGLVLPKLENLVTLNLGNNKLESAGVQCIATSIRSLTLLEVD